MRHIVLPVVVTQLNSTNMKVTHKTNNNQRVHKMETITDTIHNKPHEVTTLQQIPDYVADVIS